ncbi:MAG TPA: fibronectin type III domain-containing protein [Acidobacteriota bacterium]|nr:fibronectin type III domain-containing protein [Acidobacteriota bacterium]
MKTMTRVSCLLAALILTAGALWAAQDKTAPQAPYDLQASTRYDGATAVAVLKWRDRADNELGFEIMRSDDAGKNYKVVGLVGANTTRYENKVGKYISGAFQFKVRAFNEAGKSETSNMVSVWF